MWTSVSPYPSSSSPAPPPPTAPLGVSPAPCEGGCVNNGTCDELRGVCRCTPQFSGVRCQVDAGADARPLFNST